MQYDSEWPSFSIVTVVYNGEQFLEQTIQSVLNQKYAGKIEYVIIDGGSEDGTVNIIQKYADRLAYWVSEPDQGIYDAMNKGVRYAKGDLIGLINADDYYAADAIAQVAEAYLNNGRPEVIYGEVMYIENEREKMLMRPVADLTRLSFLSEMPINHPATFVARSVYEKHGTFSTQYKIAADWEFVWRIFNAGVHFHYLPQRLANFRLGGASTQQAYRGAKEIRNTLLMSRAFPAWDIHRAYWSQVLRAFVRQYDQSPILKQLFTFYRHHKSRTQLPSNT